MNVEDPLRKGLGPPAFDAARFATRALDEGLVDVAYGRAESPLGDLLVAMTPRGLACVSYLSSRGEDDPLQSIATRLSRRVIEARRRVDPLRRQLDDYF